MIRTMLKPFLKRFIGLFISMVFVSMLSIALLTAFVSTISNLKSTFKTYLADYEDVDSVISIDFEDKNKFDDITDVEGVEKVEYRLSIDSFLNKPDGKTITARTFSFKDDDSSLFGRYIVESIDKSEDKINVSVIRKFADNNGFKLGDSIGLGYFGLFLPCYINEIVETPEAIQPRANNYVWSDTTDFGYVYMSETELDKAMDALAEKIDEKIKNDDAWKVYYETLIQKTGITFPDLMNILVDEQHFTEKVTNQILVKAKSGYSQETVTANVKSYIEAKEVRVKSATENHNMFYYQYIEHAIEQMQVATVFLPVFFYAVTMVIIGLFINQIIKAMTPQIGVMMSVGVGNGNVISVFVAFSLLMSVVAGILGTALGVLLNRMLASVLKVVYSMPTIPLSVNPWFALIAVVSLIAFAQMTTLIACQRIFKITPKDATISNEAKRKKLSPRFEKLIERSPLNIKLALNSIAQNRRRFFVSVFSIFASFVIILLSLFFYASKAELMNQTVGRKLSFDAQVYFAGEVDDELVTQIKNDASVKEMLDCYYTYVEVYNEAGDSHTYIECLAYDETADTNLIYIPDKTAKKSVSVEKEGIILPKGVAEKLNVSAGDNVVINDVKVKVTAISYQYFHPITYLSKAQLKECCPLYISSFLVNVNDKDAFTEALGGKNTSLTVFTKSLSKDLSSVFNSVDMFINILIGFSLFMGFLILSIMGQNALMEQKRQLSIFRAIGFTVLDVSNLWTLQSVAQLLFSALFAIPFGALSAFVLFKICSSPMQTYPFIFDVKSVLFAFGFIFVTIVLSHVIAMLSIKRWNLADNTRTRE